MEDAQVLILSEGPQLRGSAGESGSAEYHPELIGKAILDLDRLKGRRYLIRFPEASIRRLASSEVFADKYKGVNRKLSICQPPHVVVGASRNFAVYADEFVVVPARQIGITSPLGNQSFLKAVALYLNSDFVIYHQFLTSTESGIQKTRNTLNSLRSLPLPIDVATNLNDWELLYLRVTRESAHGDDFDQPELVKDLNDFTFEALKLSSRARAAVEDLVRVSLGRIQIFHMLLGFV